MKDARERQDRGPAAPMKGDEQSNVVPLPRRQPRDIGPPDPDPGPDTAA